MEPKISVRDLSDLAYQCTDYQLEICYLVCKCIALYSKRGSIQINAIELMFVGAKAHY